MPLKAAIGGGEKSAARADIYIGTAKKRIARVEVYAGGAWKVGQVFAPPIALNVTPSVSGAGSSAGNITVTSAAAFATPVGGTGPYTYAWTKVSGDTLTVVSPTSAVTSFRANLGPGIGRIAVYRCTVTDSFGLTAFGDVSVTLSNNSEV